MFKRPAAAQQFNQRKGAVGERVIGIVFYRFGGKKLLDALPLAVLR
jgi:hypothetical protein